jgi:YesN/AraC family two-component response regulator
MACGCDDFLRKPLQEGELLECIGKHLGARFQYQNNSATAVTTVADANLSAQDLATVPATWRHELQHAARQADGDKVAELLEQIRSDYPAQYTTLKLWLRDYRFEDILDLAL